MYFAVVVWLTILSFFLILKLQIIENFLEAIMRVLASIQQAQEDAGDRAAADEALKEIKEEGSVTLDEAKRELGLD